MKIQIRSPRNSKSKALQDYAERRMLFALGRFASQVSVVTVRFFDLNGPKGGEDKSCRMLVKLRQGSEFVLEEIEGDYYRALDFAAERMSRRIARTLERIKHERRAHAPMWGWENGQHHAD